MADVEQINLKLSDKEIAAIEADWPGVFQLVPNTESTVITFEMSEAPTAATVQAYQLIGGNWIKGRRCEVSAAELARSA